MPSGYVPPHLRTGAQGPSTSGRGRGGRFGAGGRGAESVLTGTDAVVADALRRKDAAEKKLSRDGAVASAASVDALVEVANALRSVLHDTRLDTVKFWEAAPGKRHTSILALGETLVAIAQCTLVASRVGPLHPNLIHVETEARKAAVTAYNEAIDTFTHLCGLREQYVAEQKIIAHSKPVRLYQQNAFGVGGVHGGRKDETRLPLVAVELANVAAGALANALAGLGDVFVQCDEHAIALPVLLKAEIAYDTVANRCARSVQHAENSYQKTIEESRRDAAGSNSHSVALQQQQQNAASRGQINAATDVLDALWNLGDARGKLGECYGARGEFSEACGWRKKAFEAFDHAVSLADSNAGDDLSGLLYDWGCVWVAHVQTLCEELTLLVLNLRSADASSGVSLDASCSSSDRERLAQTITHKFHETTLACVASDEKLRNSIEFSQGDTSGLVARGELLQTKNEIVRLAFESHNFVATNVVGFFDDDGMGTSSTASSTNASTNANSLINSGNLNVDQLCFHLRQAIADNGKGFGAALTVDQRNFDAVVGVGECYFELGKIAIRVFGDSNAARSEFTKAWQTYQKALQIAQHGGNGNGAHLSGDDPGNVKDRLQVAYAAACAAYAAGETETAGELLANVLACGGCTRTQISNDEDLVGLSPGAWGG